MSQPGGEQLPAAAGELPSSSDPASTIPKPGMEPCLSVDLGDGTIEVLDEERRGVLLRHAAVLAAGGDPERPPTAAEAFRPPADLTPAQGAGLLAAMLLVLLSGLASGLVVDALGVRVSALVLLAVAVAATRGLRGAAPAGRPPVGGGTRTILFGLLVVAALAGSSRVLALVPALVHAAVAAFLASTLGDERSLIEKAARTSHPLAPSFIASYCRALTGVWAFVFAASAGLTAVLALAGEGQLHRSWTGWMFWSLLAAFSAAEFFWRKARFRYFGRGPFDRLLARVFPPQDTARGRRSQAYLLAMRAELARLAGHIRSGHGAAPPG